MLYVLVGAVILVLMYAVLWLLLEQRELVRDLHDARDARDRYKRDVRYYKARLRISRNMMDTVWKRVQQQDAMIQRMMQDRKELLRAVHEVYYAANWSADRPVDEVRLWTDLRDAAGFTPGGTAHLRKEE